MLSFQLKCRFQEHRTQKNLKMSWMCLLLSFVEPGLARTLPKRYRYNFQKTCTLGKLDTRKIALGILKNQPTFWQKKYQYFSKLLV